MTTQRLLMAILLGPALLGACESDGQPGKTSDPSSTGADTEPTTGSTTGDTTGDTTDKTSGDTASDSTGEPTTATTATTAGACDQAACSDECALWSDEGCSTVYYGECQAGECVCEPGPGECGPLFPSVACGDAMCNYGQICVQPGIDCDYNQDPPKFFTPPPLCQDVPGDCATRTDSDLSNCLGAAFCEFSVVGDPAYQDGQLDCPPEAADCF